MIAFGPRLHGRDGLLTEGVDPLTKTDAEAPAAEDQANREQGARSQARLATLLRAHFQTVWRAMRRFGVPLRSAEDAAQEVFIVLAAKLDEVQPGKELSFLYAVAARVASNLRRSSIHRHEDPGEAPVLDGPSSLPDAEVLLEQKRHRELLDRILDTLTQDLRTAFVLFELEDLTVPEIAEVLEIPTGTVASRLRRAREQFGTALTHAQRRLK